VLASLLFGRPVPQKAAASAFQKFKEDGWDSPDRFIADDHHPLWHELWEGDYHRMSSVMSEELRDVMRVLIADYDAEYGSAPAVPALEVLVGPAGSAASKTRRAEYAGGRGWPRRAPVRRCLRPRWEGSSLATG
jgi:hypothetical protein